MNNEQKNKFVPGICIGMGIALEILAIISLVDHFTNGYPARNAFFQAVMGLGIFIIGATQLKKKS